MNKIILVGNGRLSHSLQKYLNLENVLIFDKENISYLNKVKGDLLIDCSLPESFPCIYEYIKEKQIPLIIASTNHDDKQLKQIEDLANDVPIFLESNFSLGINIINLFLKKYKNVLSSYDCFIFDFHHKNKIDKPSGTSKKLLKNLKEDTPCFSIRSKNIIGEHIIKIYGEEEEINIGHKITSRDVFAKGILLAINYIKKKKNGLYNMEDIIDEI